MQAPSTGGIFQNPATNVQPQSHSPFGQNNAPQNNNLFGGGGAQTIPSFSSGNQQLAQQNINPQGRWSPVL